MVCDVVNLKIVGISAFSFSLIPVIAQTSGIMGTKGQLCSLVVFNSGFTGEGVHGNYSGDMESSGTLSCNSIRSSLLVFSTEKINSGVFFYTSSVDDIEFGF